MSDLVNELRALEERLLLSEVRASREALEALLAEDFIEHGQSGRRYDREAVIATLAAEPPRVPPTIHDFAARLLSPDVALVTYRLRSATAESVRVSVWCRRAAAWGLVFHQGTAV